MPATVNAAFDAFLKERVNLDPDETEVARASRDWLLAQVAALPAAQSSFPVLYREIDIHYGSFARRTKIRELDDVDLIVGVSGLGTTYMDAGTSLQLTVPDGIALRNYCHDGTNLLNSRKVVNAFVSGLASVPQYEKAEIRRNGSAAVLKLKSYPWSFDIVPGFMTTPEWNGRTYYIIPDGQGHWMKTDPRIDHERVTRVNQFHDGHVLNAVRLVKYWNRRPTMPTMPSYLLECILLAFYDGSVTKASAYPDIEMIRILEYLAGAILGSVSDPKGIQGDLNALGWGDRLAISARASSDLGKCQAARAAEQQADHKKAIGFWGEVFGPDFPVYG